jgi:iron complex outermembrane receptor protein
MKRLFSSMAALAIAVVTNAQNKAALYDSTQVEALQKWWSKV